MKTQRVTVSIALSSVLYATAACSLEVPKLGASSKVTPGAGGDAAPPATTACDAPRGLVRDQSFDGGDGATYAYDLNVPAGYDCSRPASLLVDVGLREEAETSPAVVALSEKEGFVYVRLKLEVDGLVAWVNQRANMKRGEGAPPERAVLAALLARVEGTYAVDPARRYLFGFSHGGSYPVASLAENDDDTFHGFAFVGGAGDGIDVLPSSMTKPVYVSAGFRAPFGLDGLAEANALVSRLPPSQTFFREMPTSSYVRPFHYAEAFAFLALGARPSSGPTPAVWSARPRLPASVYAAVRTPAGALALGASTGSLVTGARVVVSDDGTGALPPSALPFTGLPRAACALDDGTVVLATTSSVQASHDGGGTFAVVAPLEPSERGAVTCAGNVLTVYTGKGGVAESTDGGVTFHSALGPFEAMRDAPVTAALATAGGTQVVAIQPADFLVRRAGETSFSTLSGAWDYAVQPLEVTAFATVGKTVWAVGTGGYVGRWVESVANDPSDRATFVAEALPTTEDLYAVSFYDADHGLVAGAHGTVFTTDNGGKTWTARPTGSDDYIGAAFWTSPTHPVLLGGHGLVLDGHL